MTPELSWLATALLSPPDQDCPQVTTEPLALSAAKAVLVEKIWLTPELSWLATALLLPPSLERPQVTTEPSLFRAAKALVLLASPLLHKGRLGPLTVTTIPSAVIVAMAVCWPGVIE